MADVEEDGLVLTEENERSWRAYLDDFVNEVYPVFKKYGFTVPEAFLAWQMNRVNNSVAAITDDSDT